MTNDDIARALIEKIDNDLPAAVAKLDTATEELKADRGERKEFEDSVRRWTKVGAIILAAHAVLLIATAYGTYNIIDGRSQSRGTQASILDQIQETKGLNDLIADCVNPDGDCARESAASTASVVAEIIRRGAELQVAIAACTYRETESAYRACTDVALSQIGVPE